MSCANWLVTKGLTWFLDTVMILTNLLIDVELGLMRGLILDPSKYIEKKHVSIL